MITDETIDKALVECMRTMKALEALRAIRKDPGVLVDGYQGKQYRVMPSQVKAHAAAKRASMDLTRKLADLRAGR